jgi:uncharacterized lipoprotein YddW (UPF0748 family)
MSLSRRRWLEQSACGAGLAAATLLGGGCSAWTDPSSQASGTPSGSQRLPSVDLEASALPDAPLREWRAAWVASVAHIDWPKQPGLSAPVLRAQILQIVQRAQAIGLNALILQVRPAADALYRSDLEPPSEYLSADGQPELGFDALQEWITVAHAHGLELHAWFNPYRARHPSARQPIHENHVARRHPEWVHRYGDFLWLDPGHPEAQAHSLNVISDVVRRYDLDGVHVDDYFYPYPIKGSDGRDIPFPDQESFKRHRRAGLSDKESDRAKWRRENVDRFVEQMYKRTHALKPWVQVTISPFGIGRPDRRPSGIAGFSQYDHLHADVEHWCEQGWLDALVPQLYWPRNRPAQSFEKLLDYWLSANPQGRHVWPGLYTSSVANGTPTAWAAEEVLWQIDRQRERRASTGHAHFSLQALMNDRGGLATELPRSRYATAALPPATPWWGTGTPPSAAQAYRLPDGRVTFTSPAGAPSGPSAAQAARRFMVWRRPVASESNTWALRVVQAQHTLDAGKSDELIVVQALDAVGREGPRQAFIMKA